MPTIEEINEYLYALRHFRQGTHMFSEFESDAVVIERMTEEETDKIFG